MFRVTVRPTERCSIALKPFVSGTSSPSILSTTSPTRLIRAGRAKLHWHESSRRHSAQLAKKEVDRPAVWLAIVTALLVVVTAFLWSATVGLAHEASQTSRRQSAGLCACEESNHSQHRSWGETHRKNRVPDDGATPAYRLQVGAATTLAPLSATPNQLKTSTSWIPLRRDDAR